MQNANGIKAYWRETFKRWWNYRGLWRESLAERPSAAFVYRGLLISYICLYVLFIYVNPHYSIEKWILITLEFMVPFIVSVILWYWGKIKNNRHVISVLMYLMILIIGRLVTKHAGSLYRLLKPTANDLGFFYRFLEPPPPGAPPYYAYQEAYSIWWDLYFYLMIPTLLLLPILVMWIQGWRQALIFSLIVFLPYYLILRLAAGKGF